MRSDAKNNSAFLDLVHEGKANPFEILGLPAWVIRDLSVDQLKEILRSYKKTLAKLFHPDSPLNANRSTYQQRIAVCSNQALHDLLSDDWYLRKCANDYKNGSLVELLRARQRASEIENKRCKNEIRDLKGKIRETENRRLEEHKSLLAQIGLLRKTQLDRERECRNGMRKPTNSKKREKAKPKPLGLPKGRKRP